MTEKWAWIGGNDIIEEKVWVWDDGTEFDYVNWMNANEPNNHSGKEHCMMLGWFGSSTGLWNDLACETKMTAMCNGKMSGKKTQGVSEKKYVVRNRKAKFWEAEEICQAQGGNLASILNEADNTMLWDTILKASKSEDKSNWNKLWIGAHDNENEGAFVWTDG